MAGLYFHIPFCKQACHYCDFHFSTNLESRVELCDALCTELELQQNYLDGETIETLYFGGGTPSILSAADLGHIFRAVNLHYIMAPTSEITLEANPDDLNPSKLSALRQLGINRLSIGIQSFDEEVLRFLNRAHTATEAAGCIPQARAAGFTNVSLDLIYAIPGQEDETWINNIERAIALHPEHISAYALTLEEKTVFGQWHKKGNFPSIDEDFAARQLEQLIDRLTRAGYEHYEVSNFCKPGLHAVHNTNYWRQKKYLGIGPSAHSYNGDSRQANISNNHRYISQIRQGSIPFEKEILTRKDKINEYLFIGLRTRWGCDLEFMKAQWSYDLLLENGEAVTKFQQAELMEITDHTIRLTRRGLFLADQVVADLFLLE